MAAERFRFEAFDRQGRREHGEIDAEDETTALNSIAAKGLTPYRIIAASEGNDAPWWARDYRLGGERVPRAALAQFLTAFALMLEARLPLSLALASAREDVADRRLVALVERAERGVAEGQRLSDSLASEAKIFPEHLLSLVRLGEEANRLPAVIRYAAENLEREMSFSAELRAALTYPIILLVASVAVVLGLVFFLAPSLAPVFDAVRAEPPFLIRVMMGVRQTALAQWPLLLLGSALSVGILLILLHRGSTLLGSVVLRLPVIGPILRDAETLRVTMTLSLMISSGASLLVALSTAREACRSALFADLIGQAEEHVRSGGKLTGRLREGNLLNPTVVQMIRIGEDADKLDEMLARAVDVLDERVRRRISSILSLATPVLTLMIGAIVGALVFSTLSAILEINELAF